MAEARRTTLWVESLARVHRSSPSTTSKVFDGPVERSLRPASASAGRGDRGRAGLPAPRLRVNHVAL